MLHLQRVIRFQKTKEYIHKYSTVVNPIANKPEWQTQKVGHLLKEGVLFSRVKSENESCSVVSDSLWRHGLYSPWNSPWQNMGVGSLSLLQGIFPIQGSNPGLLLLYQLSHQGSPRILKWVLIPSPADLPDPGIEPGFPALHVDSLPSMFTVNMCAFLVTQLCLTLCDPMDCGPPGSSVHGDSPGKNIGVGCHALL